ncbi:MAG: hypothetical protein ACJ76H_08125 [Bacteriovoracaceae bacterium]
MKSFIFISLIALSVGVYADDDLPVIEDQADEQVLAIKPAVETETVAAPAVEAAPAPETEATEVAATEVATTEPQPKVISTQPINVDGYMRNEKPVADPELQDIRSEISRQKKEIVLNKVKAKEFKELGKSTEQLSETTEDMLLERRAAKEEIANYNKKVQCLSAENPGPDCDKFVRKRR